jgi:hypothetical protein
VNIFLRFLRDLRGEMPFAKSDVNFNHEEHEGHEEQILRGINHEGLETNDYA